MSAFLERLREIAGRRRRLSLDQVWAAFRDAEPVQAASTRQRESLRRALDRLEESGALQLPRAKRLWDRSAEPALPSWIQLPGVAASEAPPIGDVAWAPELQFAHEVRRGDQLEALLAVQRFLAEGGRDRPFVPARERAIGVFGDEKAIDRLARTALFGSGRLTYEVLRAFPMSPPMVCERFPGARTNTALLIENHHTYHSFVRWNRKHEQYCVVGYGAGKAAWSSIASLRETATETEPESDRSIEHIEPNAEHSIERIEYFGDLDREGVRIAAKLAIEARRAGLPPVVPALRWYELLLSRGGLVPAMADEGRALDERDSRWLGPKLRERAERVLGARQRLPQELVGWEVLRTLCDEPDRTS